MYLYRCLLYYVVYGYFFIFYYINDSKVNGTLYRSEMCGEVFLPYLLFFFISNE